MTNRSLTQAVEIKCTCLRLHSEENLRGSCFELGRREGKGLKRIRDKKSGLRPIPYTKFQLRAKIMKHCRGWNKEVGICSQRRNMRFHNPPSHLQSQNEKPLFEEMLHACQSKLLRISSVRIWTLHPSTWVSWHLHLELPRNKNFEKINSCHISHPTWVLCYGIPSWLIKLLTSFVNLFCFETKNSCICIICGSDFSVSYFWWLLPMMTSSMGVFVIFQLLVCVHWYLINGFLLVWV